MRLLLIEDEEGFAKALQASLKTRHYITDWADNGRDGLEHGLSNVYDVIILDIMLPEMDGLTVLRKLRENGIKTPVLLLTAKSELDDKVTGFDMGADDYLTKPFSSTELLARIRVAIRHMNRRDMTIKRSVIQVKGLRLDMEKHLVYLNDEEVHMTPMEYTLLSLLLKNRGKVVTTATIIKELWGPGYGQDTQALRTLMAGLRRKIEENPAKPQYIMTEIGVGYRIRDE